MLGAPAKPMAEVLRSSLVQAVAISESVREAYLPQCFVLGTMLGPSQVLVVVVENGMALEHVVAELSASLQDDLPEIPLWVIENDDPLLPDIRSTGTGIK